MACRHPDTGRNIFLSKKRVHIMRNRAYNTLIDSQQTDERSDIRPSPVVNSTIVLNPVDKKAFVVTRPGPQVWPNKKNEWRGVSIPKLRAVPSDMPNLIGATFGFLTVVGLSQHSGKRGEGRAAAWVCRCRCGYYILRRTRAVKNPNNVNDACEPCLNTDRAEEKSYRIQVFRETGQWPEHWK